MAANVRIFAIECATLETLLQAGNDAEAVKDGAEAGERLGGRIGVLILPISYKGRETEAFGIAKSLLEQYPALWVIFHGTINPAYMTECTHQWASMEPQGMRAFFATSEHGLLYAIKQWLECAGHPQ